MSELVPCPGCRRHVVVGERACPFCARALPALRPQRVSLTGRVSRAAVFAAVAACSKSDKPNPPPAAHGSGSDDLEKLLDYEPRAAEHPDAVASDAAIALDAPALADAGVDAAPPDAGVKKKKKKHVQQQQQINDQLVAPPPPPWDPNNIPKPYGAPPARKRIV